MNVISKPYKIIIIIIIIIIYLNLLCYLMVPKYKYVSNKNIK